jgi:hypothetical protein
LGWWHLLAIQKSLALLKIMLCGMMDLTPLFYISREMERHLLLLLHVLLLAITMIPVINMICSIDLPIVLLLLPWWLLVT